MGSVSEDFSASVAGSQIRTAELYRVTLRTGQRYYFTSHQRAIEWNGQTYDAFPIQRDPIQSNVSGEIDETRVYVAGMTGSLADIVATKALDDAEIEIVEIVRGSVYGVGQERPLFLGWADIEYSRQFIIFTLRPWLMSLNMVVPRNKIESACNWSIFESFCGLLTSSFSYVSAATDGTVKTVVDSNRGILYKAQFTGDTANTIKKGETIAGGLGGGVAVVANVMYEDDGTGRIWYCELIGTQFVDGETVLVSGGGSIAIDGDPIEDGVLYQRGELRILTGDNAGERRMILSDQSTTITFLGDLPYAVEPDDSYALYPGCDGRIAEVCHSWYGNTENSRGYTEVPRVEDTML